MTDLVELIFALLVLVAQATEEIEETKNSEDRDGDDNLSPERNVRKKGKLEVVVIVVDAKLLSFGDNRCFSLLHHANPDHLLGRLRGVEVLLPISG